MATTYTTLSDTDQRKAALLDPLNAAEIAHLMARVGLTAAMIVGVQSGIDGATVRLQRAKASMDLARQINAGDMAGIADPDLPQVPPPLSP